MLQAAKANRTFIQSLHLERLYHIYRLVDVTVLDGDHQVDGFQISSPDTLSAALKPIYRHLSRTSTVEFAGVEDRRLPLGIRSVRRRVPLANLQAALSFLTANQG